MNDVRMLLLDKLAVDSAHKLKQRAFRFYGLLLTDSDASKFVSRFVVREHTFLRTARNASGEVYGNIQTAAQYNVAMMDAEDLSDQPQHAGGRAAHIPDPEPRLLAMARKTAKKASASLTVEEKQALADATAATISSSCKGEKKAGRCSAKKSSVYPKNPKRSCSQDQENQRRTSCCAECWTTSAPR